LRHWGSSYSQQTGTSDAKLKSTSSPSLNPIRSASPPGRAVVNGVEGVSTQRAYLKKRPNIRIILVEKTDRLYRNLKDWVTLDELDIEIHLVKEGIVLSHESKSSEKFVHGIKVLMAKNYIDSHSEEARKGQQEKAEQGICKSSTIACEIAYTRRMSISLMDASMEPSTRKCRRLGSKNRRS
jgi:DNA invertase Pin-like site-specific DNA recombinase